MRNMTGAGVDYNMTGAGVDSNMTKLPQSFPVWMTSK